MKISGAGVFAAVLTVVSAIAPAAYGGTYSSVVVIGDSLSDNGNLYAATAGLVPAAPYYAGRFSNGPVAVEYLAQALGAPLFDFAFGGATTGTANSGNALLPAPILPGMMGELAGLTQVPTSLVPSSLFVVWGGANDYEAGGDAATAAANIDKIVGTLKANGATHILVPGLPNLGLTPEYYNSTAASAFSTTFDQILQSTLPAGTTYFDTLSLLDAIVAHPAAYGLGDVTNPCYPGSFLTPGLTPCSDPNSYLFWDDIHPTTAADALLAESFLGAVTTTSSTVTPEPGSIVLLGTGLAGMAGVVRRRRMGSR